MCLYPKKIVHYETGQIIRVQCGRCYECEREKANEWSLRIMQEASLYEKNCFVTLTYDEEHVPLDFEVSRREVQLFMKRLRKKISPARVRFFACGEYGSKRGRPHYHFILFGFFPPDAELLYEKKSIKYYTSDFLSEVWTKGFITISEVTLESAKYCAKYLQKFVVNDEEVKQKPFVQMSNRPGIGFDAINPDWIKSDSIYYQGKKFKIPRYYLDSLEKDGYNLVELRNNRLKGGEMFEKNFKATRESRLARSETVLSLAFKKAIRQREERREYRRGLEKKYSDLKNFTESLRKKK